MDEIIFNTGESADELKNKYNPEGSLKRKIQLRLMDMLVYLDKVCNDIGVNYRIDSGMVLGAVRHGGFIPWDDDMDVAIDNYGEYKRLCDYLKKNPHPQYVLQDDTTDNGHFKYWSTLRDIKSEYIHLDKGEDLLDRMLQYRGLQIDICPFGPGIIRSIYLKYADFNSREKWAMLEHNKLKAKAIHSIRKYVCNPLLRGVSRFWGNQNFYMYSYGIPFKYRFIPKDVLFPYKPILFEGIEVPGPAKPIEYCKIFWGDYMKLPPVEERNSHNVTYKIWD